MRKFISAIIATIVIGIGSFIYAQCPNCTGATQATADQVRSQAVGTFSGANTYYNTTTLPAENTANQAYNNLPGIRSDWFPFDISEYNWFVSSGNLHYNAGITSIGNMTTAATSYSNHISTGDNYYNQGDYVSACQYYCSANSDAQSVQGAAIDAKEYFDLATTDYNNAYTFWVNNP